MAQRLPDPTRRLPGAASRGRWRAFSIELEDKIGRTRGSSAADPDLGRARGLLNFPPDIWFFDFSKSFLPTITSAQNYRAARQALLAYNQRVAAQRRDLRRPHQLPRPPTRPDRRSTSARSRPWSTSICARPTSWPISFDADRLFYQIKGRLYAYHMLLQELGRDFDRMIRPKNNVQNISGQLMDTFARGGQMRPSVVIDGPPWRTCSPAISRPGLLPQARWCCSSRRWSQVLRNWVGPAPMLPGSVGCWCAWRRWAVIGAGFLSSGCAPGNTRGQPLEVWRTHVPARRSPPRRSRSSDWPGYLAAEEDGVRRGAERGHPEAPARGRVSRSTASSKGDPIYPGTSADSWNRTHVLEPAVRPSAPSSSCTGSPTPPTAAGTSASSTATGAGSPSPRCPRTAPCLRR